MHNNFPDKTRKISENYFFNFYFLKVDISLTMHDLNLRLHICVQDIVMEGTVSQIFSKIDSCPFFDIKQKLRHKSKF